MTYAASLQKEYSNAQFLTVIKPYIGLSDFTLYSGSVYRKSFTQSKIIGVTEDGTSYTEAASVSLSAGQFYYDEVNQYLYVRTTTSGAPSGFMLVGQFELYLGTYDAHWYRVPTDSSTSSVYFEPLVTKAPMINQGGSDTAGGFFPTKSTQIDISNATHYFDAMLNNASFNRAPIEIYHWLDESRQDQLSVANIKKVFTGYCSSVQLSDVLVSIKVMDATDAFNDEWRNPTGDSFFSSTTFASIDPSEIGKPIKYVYGLVNGLVPTNIDYVKDNPTTSDNRQWVACHGTKASMGIVATTVTGASSTTTRTYVVTTNGLNVGDAVNMNHIAAGHHHHVTITAINRTSHYFDHEAIHSAMNAGDNITRECIGNVIIIQNGQAYRAQYDRDYTVDNFSGTTVGFTFTSTLEANLTMPATLSVNDRVVCRVYGKTNDVTFGGVGFGSDDTQAGVLCHPITILVDVLKRVLSESEINGVDLAALYGARTDAVGFSIPQASGSKFTTYKDIILDLCQTCLLRVFPDDDLKWAASAIGPLGTSVYDLTEEEIVAGSFSYNFDFSEIVSHMIVGYERYEMSDVAARSGEQYTYLSTTSDTALYLHRVKRQKTVNSLYFKSADATTLLTRLAYLYGDRRGELEFMTTKASFSAEVGASGTVSRQSMPGFSYVSGTQNLKSAVIVNLDKSLNTVRVVMDDQKGIQDNSGTW